MSHLLEVASTLPDFGLYLLTAFLLLTTYSVIYTAVTPHPEWSLLRQGNLSAALAFGGSMVGFVLPLCSAIAHSVSIVDVAVWGLVAMVVQITAFFVLRLAIPTISKDIESDRPGPATAAALFFLAIGLVNAACMTW